MADEAEKDRVPGVAIASVNGSSASDDGEHIKVGFTLAQGQRVDAIMSVDRATDMMTLVGGALGEARRKKTNDPLVRYTYPVQSWTVAPQQNDQLLVFVFRLPSGMEMCFQFDRNGARSFLEGLSATLGLLETPTIPQSRKH